MIRKPNGSKAAPVPCTTLGQMAMTQLNINHFSRLSDDHSQSRVAGCSMIARALTTAALPIAALLASAVVATTDASASERDRRFFEQVKGEWSGPGEIVAGKYKGTRFVCNFTGATPQDKVGMSLDGGCRVGLFTQKMSATVEHKGRQGYRGSFMDGAVGEGLDVISGSVSSEKVVFNLNRKQLDGAMLARLPNKDTMHVTVSVKVEGQMVPVIGMNLKRVDGVTVGSVAEQ